MNGFIVIDGPNLAHIANNTGPLSVGDMPTTAIYGVLRAIRPMIKMFPMMTPVVCFDGRSWRKDVFAEYKANRDRAATKADLRFQALREQLKVQMPHIKTALALLGIRQITAANYEADDLGGLMVKRNPGAKILLVTGDKDWIQLLRPGVTWLDPVRNVRLTEKNLPARLGWSEGKLKAWNYDQDAEDFMGVPSPRAWLEMKALMGDTSDDIPGVGAIGEKGALEMMHEFGSVQQFLEDFDRGALDKMKIAKKKRDFAASADKRAIYRRNMELMDLVSGVRPAPSEFKLTTGKPDKAAFGKFCHELLFKSITNTLDEWFEPFERAAA